MMPDGGYEAPDLNELQTLAENDLRCGYSTHLHPPIMLALIARLREAEAQAERLANVVVIANIQAQREDLAHVSVTLRGAVEGLTMGQRYVTAEYMNQLIAERVEQALAKRDGAG